MLVSWDNEYIPLSHSLGIITKSSQMTQTDGIMSKKTPREKYD